ncbi:MAG TPA: prepilin-type N-terminal cleavage/methylation domain-containing protein [Terriglobales bacterium]|nr:prepilin-type N-terminal cleavage/methylation domain-containing protein [Terriglobales bacterium]
MARPHVEQRRTARGLRRSALAQAGFTLIELMIVIAIIVILMGFAAPRYQQSVLRARESVLREDLYVMRSAIDQYTLDKKRAPQNLQELVEAGYLKTIPKDPITDSTETWQLVNEDTTLSVDQTQPGVSDVKSGAPGTSSEGTPYSEW